MEFNEKQKELINEYHEALVYGFKKISSIPLDLKRVRVRKRILYFMMGASQSYSESILKLMGSSPTYEKPGESLLRSQFEIWLNIRFIYSSRSEDKARLFLSDLIMQSNEFAKRHKRLWDKYPTWNMEFGTIKKAGDWEIFIKENSELLSKDRKRYKDKNVNKLPTLFDRTIAIDAHLKKIGKFSENNSAEKFYTLFYPYFSDSVHSTMPGLTRYMRGPASAREPFLDIDSKPDDAERILAVSYICYCATLQIFLQIYNAYNPTEFTRFNKYSKSLENPAS